MNKKAIRMCPQWCVDWMIAWHKEHGSENHCDRVRTEKEVICGFMCETEVKENIQTELRFEP